MAGEHGDEVGDVVGATPAAGDEVVDLEAVTQPAVGAAAALPVAQQHRAERSSGEQRRRTGGRTRVGCRRRRRSTGSIVALARSCSTRASGRGIPQMVAGPVEGHRDLQAAAGRRGSARVVLAAAGDVVDQLHQSARAARCSNGSHGWPVGWAHAFGAALDLAFELARRRDRPAHRGSTTSPCPRPTTTADAPPCAAPATPPPSACPDTAPGGPAPRDRRSAPAPAHSRIRSSSASWTTLCELLGAEPARRTRSAAIAGQRLQRPGGLDRGSCNDRCDTPSSAAVVASRASRSSSTRVNNKLLDRGPPLHPDRLRARLQQPAGLPAPQLVKTIRHRRARDHPNTGV